MSDCPFDVRLARTPYLVLPKLAIQAMPLEWRQRLESLLAEADDAGLETPSYLVFRDEPEYIVVEQEDEDDQFSRVSNLTSLRDDPWSNYRHGKIKELCPGFALSPKDTGGEDE